MADAMAGGVSGDGQGGKKKPVAILTMGESKWAETPRHLPLPPRNELPPSEPLSQGSESRK